MFDNTVFVFMKVSDEIWLKGADKKLHNAIALEKKKGALIAPCLIEFEGRNLVDLQNATYHQIEA